MRPASRPAADGAPVCTAVRHAVSRRLQRQPAEERAGDLRDLPARPRRRALDAASLVMLAGARLHRAVLSLLGRIGHAGRSRRQVGHRAHGEGRRDLHHGDSARRASGRQACRSCFAALFCLGTHSTVFGPIKYALLPQHLREARAGRRQCADRGGHVPRDPARHDPWRKLVLLGDNGALIVGGSASSSRWSAGSPRVRSRRRRPVGGRCAAPAPAARHDRRRRARGVAADDCFCRSSRCRGSGCSAPRGVGTAGLCQGRALRRTSRS